MVDAMNSLFFLKKPKGKKSPEVVLSGPLPPHVVQKRNWSLCELCVQEPVKMLLKTEYENQTTKE